MARRATVTITEREYTALCAAAALHEAEYEQEGYYDASDRRDIAAINRVLDKCQAAGLKGTGRP